MTTSPRDPELYCTADLGTAVYLFTTDHELTKTTHHGPKRLVFHFLRREDTEAQVEKYLNEKGLAPAKRLFENYRALRALAFEKTGNVR